MSDTMLLVPTPGTYPYPAYEIPGVEVVLELNDPHASYSFNSLVVIRYKDALWIAQDSGCSCPTPFDGATWTRLTSWEQFCDWVDNRWCEGYGDYGYAQQKKDYDLLRHQSKEQMSAYL